MTDYSREYRRWLDSPAISNAEWRELDAVSGDADEIESRFYAPLKFGTAGLRGIMGVGLNRMNVHVVRHVTQAFAAVILGEGAGFASRGVVICHDCRLNSRDFAMEASAVMAANGVPVRLVEDMRPTPELSFAIRHYGAAAGINITASHNPKEYNGYKAYWSEGAQLTRDRADMVAAEMDRIDIFTGVKRMSFDETSSSGLVTLVGAELDEAYLGQVLAQSIDRAAVEAAADELKIVYTPFHGAGRLLVPEALRRLGVRHIYPVEEQMVPDGSFPTVESPNPENPEGFYLAVALAERVGSNLIIGTDPDSDRVGVMAERNGRFLPISGNQMGVLLMDYILSARRRTGTLPDNAAVVKSIVTTSMASAVANSFGVHMDDTFTGFRFMAERIAQYEAEGSYRCVMAFEESYGYMIGDFVRDKDAVTTSVLIAEMAAYYHGRGMTLWDAMDELYGKYGCYAELTTSVMMPGIDGLRDMEQLMRRLREEPPEDVGGVKVVRVRDYLEGRVRVPGLGAVDATEISGMDVLYFELEDGSTFIVRPSGTEPKIKIYITVKGDSDSDAQHRVERLRTAADELK